MQVVIFWLLCTCMITASVLATPQMSDAQLEQMLTDRVLMQRHLKCVVGEGPCDDIGKRFRTAAPLVLRGVCPQCSEQEVRQIRRTLAYVQRNYPWEWSKMIRHYG